MFLQPLSCQGEFRPYGFLPFVLTRQLHPGLRCPSAVTCTKCQTGRRAGWGSRSSGEGKGVAIAACPGCPLGGGGWALWEGDASGSENPVLPALILAMDHTAPNRISLSLSLSLSLCVSLFLCFVASWFLLPRGPWSVCTGAEPGPWDAPGKGLAGELPPPSCGVRRRALGWRQEM